MATQPTEKEGAPKSTSWSNTGLKKLHGANSCVWQQGSSKRVRGRQASNITNQIDKLNKQDLKKIERR